MNPHLVVLVEDDGGHDVTDVLFQDGYEVRRGGGGHSLAGYGLILLCQGEVTELMELLIWSSFHQETDLVLGEIIFIGL